MAMVTRAIDWDFELPFKSEDELRLFVLKAWGVTIPDVQVCPNHTTPWRAFADAYFSKAPVTVWKGSRGLAGKSYLLALLGLTEAVTLHASVNILGGSGEQSENVHKYCQDFWNYESAPTGALASDPAKRETKLVWGNTIKALTASQRSVRGPHPQRLRLDEIDEMDLEIFDAAMGQTMASTEGGEVVIAAQTVASSTHQNADGTMTEVLKRAGEKGWPVYEWCYKETSTRLGGWLVPSEIERKRSEVTAMMWSVEYDLQEPSPENRAIQPDKVSAMFQKKLGEFKGANGEYIEIEPPMWVCEKCGMDHDETAALGGLCEREDCEGELYQAEYATAADWARKKDWTVIITLRMDVDPVRLVAFERLGRRPWPAMIGKFDERCQRYPGKAAHDATGIGDVVGGHLSTGADGVIMVGRARDSLLTEYIASIERCEIVSPDIEFMRNEHKYAGFDDVHGKGHLPDSIASGALAWSCRKQHLWDGIGFG